MDIRLRFFNKETEEMEPCYLMGKSLVNGLKVFVISVKDGDVHCVPLKFVMQYTGLRDSWGLPIYGGDLIKVEDDDEDWIVMFDEGGFYARGGGVSRKLSEVNDYCDIVGNCYQNWSEE